MQALPLLVLVNIVFARPATQSPHGDCNSQCNQTDLDNKQEATEVHENGHYNGFSLISGVIKDRKSIERHFRMQNRRCFPIWQTAVITFADQFYCLQNMPFLHRNVNPRVIFVRVVNVSESRVGKNYPIEKVIRKDQLALLRLKDPISGLASVRVAGNSTTDPKECVMAVTIEYSGLENGPIQPMEFLNTAECMERFKKKQKLCARSVETRWRQKGRKDNGCPLLCKNSETPMLVGIQLEADENSNIDAFIDVRKYKPWIEKMLQQ